MGKDFTGRTDRLTYIAEARDEGREVQYLLKERLKLAAGMIKTLKYNEGILLDGIVVRGTATAREGQHITALLNCKSNVPDIKPEEYPLDILYEDDAFIVINKPADTVMHPTCRHQTSTLTNYVLWHLQQKGIFSDIHLVGRLDKDTTGIVIIARNAYVQEALRRQGESGELEKHYIAAVSPPPKNASGNTAHCGVIDAPIVRDLDSIIKRKISPGGAPAVTLYKVLRVNEEQNYAIVEFILKTGRTHQIRLHTSYAGFPIIGDTLYGIEETMYKAPHQLLHAYKILLTHPITGKRLTFLSSPPPEWGEYAAALSEI